MTSALPLKLLMLGVLIYVSYFHVKSILLGRRSRDWLRVKAEITASGVDRESGTYYPKIIYRYTVNGRDYINDTYTFIGTGQMLKRSVVSIALRNPVGKQIDVFVIPTTRAARSSFPARMRPAISTSYSSRSCLEALPFFPSYSICSGLGASQTAPNSSSKPKPRCEAASFRRRPS